MVPRVGVTGIVFPRAQSSIARVLLVQRGQPPAQGLWAFPGGKLEHQATIVSDAQREVLEETGIAAQVHAPAGRSRAARQPIVAVTEAIDDTFHYVLAHTVLTECTAGSQPSPGDDAAAAAWVPTIALLAAAGSATPSSASDPYAQDQGLVVPVSGTVERMQAPTAAEFPGLQQFLQPPADAALSIAAPGNVQAILNALEERWGWQPKDRAWVAANLMQAGAQAGEHARSSQPAGSTEACTTTLHLVPSMAIPLLQAIDYVSDVARA